MKKQIDLDLIVNLDETVIYMNMVLKRTINRKGKNTIMIRTHGHKLIRISVLLCVISTGCKLIPIIIMKGKKGRIIKKNKLIRFNNPKKSTFIM